MRCRILNVLCYVGSHTLGQNASDAVYSTWPLGLTSLGPANKLLRPSTYAGNVFLEFLLSTAGAHTCTAPRCYRLAARLDSASFGRRLPPAFTGTSP